MASALLISHVSTQRIPTCLTLKDRRHTLPRLQQLSIFLFMMRLDNLTIRWTPAKGPCSRLNAPDSSSLSTLTSLMGYVPSCCIILVENLGTAFTCTVLRAKDTPSHRHLIMSSCFTHGLHVISLTQRNQMCVLFLSSIIRH